MLPYIMMDVEDQVMNLSSEDVGQVTKPKNPKRVEAGKKLAEYNRRKKEKLKHQERQVLEPHTPTVHSNVPVNYYPLVGVTVVALGLIAVLLYRTKTSQVPIKREPTRVSAKVDEPGIDVFEME